MKLGKHESPKVGLQVSALIDVVFLLLIYFMVTAALVKKEADMSFQLPTGGKEAFLPMEVVLEISRDGAVIVEGMRHDYAKHGRVINVMDACAKAGVKNLGFAQSI